MTDKDAGMPDVMAKIVTGDATIAESLKMMKDMGAGLISKAYKRGGDDDADTIAAIVLLYGEETQEYLDAIESISERLEMMDD
jgi:hypothetical protein